MTIIVPRTWIPGTPRGYGDSKVSSEWLSEMAAVLEQYRGAGAAHSGTARYEVHLEFRINPGGRKYRGQARVHGPDLDNLTKQTIDGLSHTRAEWMPPGLGIIENDSAVYSIVATKEHVAEDSEMGLWVTVKLI